MSGPAGGVDWLAVQVALQNWVVAGSGLPATKVVWGGQDAARPASPSVSMRVSNIAWTGRPWMGVEVQPLVFADLTVSAVSASANTLTIASHGRTTGDGPVQLVTSGTPPGALAESTDYWVVVVDASTIRLAATYYDAMAASPVTIDITSIGSGTQTIVATAETVRAGAELQALARGLLRVTLELRCHSTTIPGVDTATYILQRVRTRSMFQSQQDRLQAANIGLIDTDRVRAILGTRDALLFEPRSYLDCHFSVPVQEGEDLTRIDWVQITNLGTGQVRDVRR